MSIAIVSPATRNVSIFVVCVAIVGIAGELWPAKFGAMLWFVAESFVCRPVDWRRAPPVRLGDSERRRNGGRQLVQGSSHDDDRHGFGSWNDHTGLRRNRSSTDGRASGIGRAAGSGDGLLAVLTSDRSWNVRSDVGDARSGLRHWKDIGGARSRAVRWGRHSDVGLVRDDTQAPTPIAEGLRGRLPDTDAVRLQGEGLAGTRKSSGVPDGTFPDDETRHGLPLFCFRCGISPSRFPAGRCSWQLFGAQSTHAIPLAVSVGAPMYLDGYAALPLVRGLLDLGMSPGAALAFLVSGSAVSIWGVLAVAPILRVPTVMLFVALAVIGSAAAGYAFEWAWGQL